METKTQLKITAQKEFEEIFTPDLIDFLVALHQNFNNKRLELLEERKKTQKEFDQEISQNFLRRQKKSEMEIGYVHHCRKTYWTEEWKLQARLTVK